MAIETALPASRDDIVSLAGLRQEPDWLTQLRLEALESASRLELPRLEKMRLDRWHIDSYGKYQPGRAVSSLEDMPAAVKELIGAASPGGLFIQRNSAEVYVSLNADIAEKGVILADLQKAAKEHGDLVRKHLFSVVRPDENRVTALHAALFTGGIFLYVPRNVELELPLQALLISDDKEASFSPHILLVADENSSVTVVEHITSVEGTSLVHNGVVEVVAKAGARLRYASVHNLGSGATDLTYRRALLERDAKIEWIIGEMNRGDTMTETFSVLQGHGSSSDSKVITVGTGDQKLNLTTRAVHVGKSSESNMITRAVMRDHATAIINGITKIEKGATHANGEQTERVLMLSPTARGDANPMLLIDEDDVKAGHAASVGQVNKEQLYYMMSRGISRDEALKLLIYGFLEPTIKEIPLELLEKQLSELVERKLGHR
jgi:Fe-S cluster assembly protein SufD